MRNVLFGAPNPELQSRLERAATYVMSPEEIKEQRVSFIYGQLGVSSKLTKDEVREHLRMRGMY